MANQRSADKSGISVYLPRELKDRLVRRAKSLGIPTTELQERYLDAACRRIPTQKPKRQGGVTRNKCS